MAWLPTKLPPHCKIIVSCTKEENNPRLCQGPVSIENILA